MSAEMFTPMERRILANAPMDVIWAFAHTPRYTAKTRDDWYLTLRFMWFFSTFGTEDTSQILTVDLVGHYIPIRPIIYAN